MRIVALLSVVALLAVPASAEWKWDQLCPVSTYGTASWIDNDTPSDALSADDWLCGSSGPITEVYWTGWSAYGEDYIDHFRLTVWSDVPATPEDASHPGDMLWEYNVAGWDYVDPPECADANNEYHAVIPELDAFYQEAGTVYWLGIQGVMVDDGYGDAWYWHMKSQTEPTWGDDAALMSDSFEYAPWWNWGWPEVEPGTAPELYDGPLPEGWTSVDLSFRLVPEPSALLLVAFGLVVLRRRR